MATYTTEQYNTLCEAIAQGALKVKYADKEVEYRSLNEMLRIRDLMAEELGLKKSGSGRLFANFNKGFI
jgi:hypothetical protein